MKENLVFLLALDVSAQKTLYKKFKLTCFKTQFPCVAGFPLSYSMLYFQKSFFIFHIHYNTRQSCALSGAYYCSFLGVTSTIAIKI